MSSVESKKGSALPMNFPIASQPTSNDLLQLITQRRSTYTLSPASTISDTKIKNILEVALTQAPSTFGSYTTRMVLLLKEEHYKLWDTITEVVKSVTPAEKWAAHTAPRLAGFRNAYGTVLFFEDPTNARTLQKQFPFISNDTFDTFGQHTNAIHQFIVWTALTAAGLGANLQHYNPLVDDRIKRQYGIPEHWALSAQLVFGTPTQPTGPKPTSMAAPMNERLLMFGAEEPREDELRLEKGDLLEEESLLSNVHLTASHSEITAN